MQQIPFLYYVPAGELIVNGKPVISHNQDKWYVYFAAHFDYKTYNSRWMDDENVGDYCQILELDLVKEKDIFCFDNEKDALIKMKELWSITQI